MSLIFASGDLRAKYQPTSPFCEVTLQRLQDARGPLINSARHIRCKKVNEQITKTHLMLPDSADMSLNIYRCAVPTAATKDESLKSIGSEFVRKRDVLSHLLSSASAIISMRDAARMGCPNWRALHNWKQRNLDACLRQKRQ